MQQEPNHNHNGDGDGQYGTAIVFHRASPRGGWAILITLNQRICESSIGAFGAYLGHLGARGSSGAIWGRGRRGRRAFHGDWSYCPHHRKRVVIVNTLFCYQVQKGKRNGAIRVHRVGGDSMDHQWPQSSILLGGSAVSIHNQRLRGKVLVESLKLNSEQTLCKPLLHSPCSPTIILIVLHCKLQEFSIPTAEP